MSEDRALYQVDTGDENTVLDTNPDFELNEVTRLARVLNAVRLEFKTVMQTVPVFIQEKFDKLAKLLEVEG